MKNTLILLIALSPFFTFSQNDYLNEQSTTSDSILNEAPKVFLDCFFCDVEYMKQNMPFVNYVRDRKYADVHVIGLRQRTGAGGWEESFEFIGQHRFKEMVDTLSTIIGPNDSADQKRESEMNLFKLGIIRYAAKTPISTFFTIDFNQPIEQKNIVDKWKNWVFEISANGWMNGSDVSTMTSFWSEINVEKVNPDFRFEFNLSADYMESKQVLSDQTFSSILRGQDLNTEGVWSISDHFSWGIFGHARTSIFNNYALTYHLIPGIEYNLFPYSISAKKQLRISYRLGAGQTYYNETTIFDKDKEFVPHHSLRIAHRIRENWGNVNIGLNGTQYLHNTRLYSVRAFGNINLRIAKGFNFNLSGNFGITQDQISLSKTGLTDEQILTGQGQRATSYTFYSSIGLSYTFGSIFNSIVNPRFR